ncbi:unnamed protein product [Heligmosomoides polygyrus]|uniref:Type II toxin-antitoxin system PemK/MazF family toxin n=1 Tax=Heligmosomoides polygyrus TaxID=6339 RepID=A0A183GT62_HELPZ|nr:unnamed protein product [Heligmosomoides polygyrus]
MAERFAIVYFLRAKNADILPLSSIHGDCAVGETRRVTWHDKAYSAKIVFVGPKKVCERKVKDVSVNGELPPPVFDIEDRHEVETPRISADSTLSLWNIADIHVALFFQAHNEKRSMEIMERLRLLELSVPTKASIREVRDAQERTDKEVAKIVPLLGLVLRRLPEGAAKKGV